MESNTPQKATSSGATTSTRLTVEQTISRRRASFSQSPESNPLSEWYHSQRNPYAQKPVTVFAPSTLQLHLVAERQKQVLRRGRQQVLLQQLQQQSQGGTTSSSRAGSGRSGRNSSPSFVSIVLALFKWCTVLWSNRRQSRPVVVSNGD